MRGLGLQNRLHRGGDPHHGITSVLAIRALPKVLVRNVPDVVRTENRAYDTAQFERCARTVDIQLGRPPNIHGNREAISICTASTGDGGRRGGWGPLSPGSTTLPP